MLLFYARRSGLVGGWLLNYMPATSATSTAINNATSSVTATSYISLDIAFPSRLVKGSGIKQYIIHVS